MPDLPSLSTTREAAETSGIIFRLASEIFSTIARAMSRKKPPAMTLDDVRKHVDDYLQERGHVGEAGGQIVNVVFAEVVAIAAHSGTVVSGDQLQPIKVDQPQAAGGSPISAASEIAILRARLDEALAAERLTQAPSRAELEEDHGA